MASSNQQPPTSEPTNAGTSTPKTLLPTPASPPAPDPQALLLEGVGAPAMTCPQIRRSRCTQFHWDAAAAAAALGHRHTEEQQQQPCPFAFVSERAYQSHVAQVHHCDLEWMAQWYQKGGQWALDVGGRLPRYLPAEEEGVEVVDRRVREDPEKMRKAVKRYFCG